MNTFSVGQCTLQGDFRIPTENTLVSSLGNKCVAIAPEQLLNSSVLAAEGQCAAFAMDLC